MKFLDSEAGRNKTQSPICLSSDGGVELPALCICAASLAARV
jgi:hypothetical protein